MIAALLLVAVCTPLPTCSDIPPVISTQAIVVQHAEVNAGYALPSSLPFPADVTAGNTIIVGIRAGSFTGHQLTVTDSRGTAYTKAAQFELEQDTASLAIFYGLALTDGAAVVTVNDPNPGATRYSIAEVSGIGNLARPATINEGFGYVAATPSPAIPGDFVYTLISAKVDATFMEGDGGTPISSVGKLFTEAGAASATLTPNGIWGATSAAFVGGAAVGRPPCATPTPCFMWDALPEADVKGYSLYYNLPGGTPQLLLDIPCETIDDVRFCRGVDASLPIQRYTELAPFLEYELRLKGYDAEGNHSENFSLPETWCAPKLCVVPGPCS